MENLDILEEEAIHILREAYGQFMRPVLLFSGGKDSTLLIHISAKAFYPAKFPFPVMHIDTGHNFPEALTFRDELVRQKNLELIVRKVADSIREKNLTEPRDKFASRNMKTRRFKVTGHAIARTDLLGLVAEQLKASVTVTL